MKQYIKELATVAGITPLAGESLRQFARRVKVHRAYAKADADRMAGADGAYHEARAACCWAIETIAAE